MNRSQSTTGSRKALRRKLNVESFEWTDEAIANIDKGASEESKGSPQEKVVTVKGVVRRCLRARGHGPHYRSRAAKKQEEAARKLAEMRCRWKLLVPRRFSVHSA